MTPVVTHSVSALWLAGLLVVSTGPLVASTNSSGWLTRPWLKEHGLPDNRVSGLVQTPDGYLWVGTPVGLARFDGLHFTAFPSTNFVSSPNRGILAMVGDGVGGLRLAMDRGAVVALKERSVQAFFADRDLPGAFTLAEDKEQSLWISYRMGGVCRIKDKKVTRFSESDGLPPGELPCTVASDGKGRIWFAKGGKIGIVRDGRFATLVELEPLPTSLAAARDGGMWICSGFRLRKITEGTKPRDFGLFSPKQSRTESVLLEDHEGTVWIGTSFSGLFRFTGSEFEKVPTTHPGILSMTEDSQGNLWVGTDGGGLNQVRPRTVELETTESGLPFEVVQSVCQDTNGIVWVATQNGALARRQGDRWEPQPMTEEVSCLAADPSGDVWIGTRLHGLFCWRTNGLIRMPGQRRTIGQTVLALLPTRTGDLYIGEVTSNAVERLRAGHLQTLDLPPDDVRSIRACAEDASGRIWFGSSKGVLMRVDGDRLVDETGLMGGTPLSIRCLYATPDGSLWIGFAGFGVGRLKDNRFGLISSKQGLPDDYISQILADDRGWLWFGSGAGIFKVRQREIEAVAERRAARVQSVHYGGNEGLAGLQATFGVSPNSLRTTEGRFWMPMRTALALIDPDRLGENLQPPPVLLTRISAGERTVAWYGGALPVANVIGPGALDLNEPKTVLKLPPDHRRLEFEFTAPSFAGPENIGFRYRLEGLGEDWTEPGTRSATYPRLPAGDYSFQVASCNHLREWSKAATLSVSVLPFFWQTWWFRLSVFGAFTGSIIAIVRYVSFRRLRLHLAHLEQQAALHQERARIAKDIHDDLGANLTQISLLGELAHQDRGQPDKAAERINTISATARQAIKSLDEIVWAVNPRNDTLGHLIDYAGQFALDYLRLAGIRCRLDLPDQTPALELSTDVRHNLFLAVKEALNNIVKHAHASEAWLRVNAADHSLRLVIEDNGCGFEHAPENALSDGLRNMRQRLEEIGGECRIQSHPGKGTKVTLEVAMETKLESPQG